MQRANIPARRINKVTEGSPHIVDAVKNGEIQLVVNTTEGASHIRDSYSIRRNTLLANIPYFTTMSAALAAVDAMEVLALMRRQGPEVRSVQEWHARSSDRS
jgi:carbamoyl-phosphate synthase large subunit